MKKLFTLSALTVLGLTIASCGETEPSKFDSIKAKVYCGSKIKTLLRDPDSYRFENAKVLSVKGEHGTATINFRSKNGFGGYTSGSAFCEIYPKNGETWVKAFLL